MKKATFSPSSSFYWAVVALAFIAVIAAATGDDLYAILGVPRSATVKEIKSAYRRKARDTHPDKNKGVTAGEP